MKTVIGSDHAGVDLKKTIAEDLASRGVEVIDVGTYTKEAVDYPDYAEKVGRAVREGVAERGILICGSGIGASVAANKIDGIRAGLAHDYYSAHQGVEHDDMNVLVLGSRVSPESGHITQLCVHPDYRRRGFARMLLNLAASCFLRLGVSEISLTVTEANEEAIDLYRAEGYDCTHSFDAAVWQRPRAI